MPVKQFTVGASRTINLGNFESLRIEAQVIWELTDPPERDAPDPYAAAQVELRKLLEITYRNLTNKKPGIGGDTH